MRAGDETFVWDGFSLLFLDRMSSLFASTHLYCVHGISLTKNWAEHWSLNVFRSYHAQGKIPTQEKKTNPYLFSCWVFCMVW